MADVPLPQGVHRAKKWEQRGFLHVLAAGTSLASPGGELMSRELPTSHSRPKRPAHCSDLLLGTHSAPTKWLPGPRNEGSSWLLTRFQWEHKEKGKCGIPQREGTELIVPGTKPQVPSLSAGPQSSPEEPLAAHQDSLLQTKPQTPPASPEPRAGLVCPLL